MNTDILRMLTAGMRANYGFMLNLPEKLLYKTKNGNKKGEIKTKLYLCDNKENQIISDSINGGNTSIRIHEFESKDKNKKYEDINDYLVFLDISGMYCYIMKEYNFPYGSANYASKIELDRYNFLIKNKQYDQLLLEMPEFYICEADCKPNDKDIDVRIGRHEKNRLHWDCKRRSTCYNSIDIKILLKNKGDLFEIKKVLVWKKSEKVFEKWMHKALSLKDKGEQMNENEKKEKKILKEEAKKQGLNYEIKLNKPGEAMRSMGKLLADSAYGQSIMNTYNDEVQFIINVEQQF